MKINKGIIKNINKKLLAGAFVLTLVTTPLFGCSNTKLKYETNEEGQLICVGSVKHSYISNYKVVVFELNNKQNISIMDVVENNLFGKGAYYKEYFNVFGNQLIYCTKDKDTNLKIISEEYLTSYLVLYDKVKEQYSEEDLKEILELIKTDYEKESNKELVKGK